MESGSSEDRCDCGADLCCGGGCCRYDALGVGGGSDCGHGCVESFLCREGLDYVRASVGGGRGCRWIDHSVEMGIVGWGTGRKVNGPCREGSAYGGPAAVLGFYAPRVHRRAVMIGFVARRGVGS